MATATALKNDPIEAIANKHYEYVDDGFGGMLMPEDVMDALLQRSQFTPEDSSLRGAPIQGVEAQAGTVIAVGEKSYTVRVSNEPKDNLEIKGNDAKVGGRYLGFHVPSEGITASITVDNNEKMAEYDDGDSVLLSLKTVDGTLNADVVPTVEKHVKYPRWAVIDGVQYPWITFDGGDEKPRMAIVKTPHGWTIGGKAVEKQHAENVAFAQAISGEKAPKLGDKQKGVLFFATNLQEIIDNIERDRKAGAESTDYNFNGGYEIVTAKTIKKLSKQPGLIGGAIIDPKNRPTKTKGWFVITPPSNHTDVYENIFRHLYRSGFEALNNNNKK